MPNSFVVEFTPLRPMRFDVMLGAHVHGLFFELVRRDDPQAASALHALPGKKPFTVSAVLDDRGQWSTRLVPGQSYGIRITLLDDALGERLDRLFLSGRFDDLHLGDGGIAVRSVRHSTRNALCGRETYQGLASGQPLESFRLQFVSPTALRVAGRNLPLPDPVGLFSGYLAKWNAFSPVPLRPDIAAAVAEGAVVISRHSIRTDVFPLPRAAQIGYVGDVVFRVMDETIRPEISALARFAFYAGSGYKTTMGMGQTLFHPAPGQNTGPGQSGSG